jgi:hypothetical protein
MDIIRASKKSKFKPAPRPMMQQHSGKEESGFVYIFILIAICNNDLHVYRSTSKGKQKAVYMEDIPEACVQVTNIYLILYLTIL